MRSPPKRHFQPRPLNCHRQYTSRRPCAPVTRFPQSVTVALHSPANVGSRDHAANQRRGHDGASCSASQRQLRPMVAQPRWTACSSSPSVQQLLHAAELVMANAASSLKLQRQTRCGRWSLEHLDGDSALGDLQPWRIGGDAASTRWGGCRIVRVPATASWHWSPPVS